MRYAIEILKKAEEALEWQIETIAASCEDDIHRVEDDWGRD